ncbi:splicing factor 3A subunit 1-like [Acanthaster planci]|uniref:Splicing factor 3A subunit 1 n=1 Tax=Acanthaster planci TaxID=133434 RepID=A0A8B7Z1N4_ACAPL|nr:splicing factor 3A subunit 1-like [Acanthaster planci]
MPVEVIPTVTDEEIPGNRQVDETAPVVSKPMVGIIYPPPEVRNIVDKTAGFVARNGPEFEHRIRQNEINNAKFNFLNHGDPYHAYFRHKVQEFLEGKAQEPTIAPAVSKVSSLQPKVTPQATETVVLKEPPPEPEFVTDPPTISAIELDIVKLTAQFVARNGRQFLTSLMNREQRNYHFDFLRPQHSMFNYFTKLVEQYTKILIPPKDLQSRLRQEAEQAKRVMEQVNYRVQWAKHQEAQRRKEEEEREKERVAYAQVDWHGFVVVETVDFQPGEQGNFPPPLRPEEIGKRILAEKRYEQFGELEEEEDVEMEVASDEEGEEDEEAKDKDKKKKEAPPKEKEKAAGAAATPADQNTEVQDMDEGDSDMEESDEEEEGRRVPMSPPPLPGAVGSDASALPAPLPPLGEVQIRKNYDPKAPKPISELEENYLISPITGEKIAASKMQEHMRIGLLDPRWIEQRDRQKEKSAQEEVYAPGPAIEESLKLLAERRTDIFGEGDVETQIGKKLGEEEDTKTKQKVIWDGHSASMEATARKAQANITIDEQIAALHKAQGLVPDKEKEKIGPQPVTKAATPIPPPPSPPQPKPAPTAAAPMPEPKAAPPMPFPPRMPIQQQQPAPPPPQQPPAVAMMPMPPRPPMPPRMPMGMPRMGGGLLPGPPLRFMNQGPRMGGQPMPMGGQHMGAMRMPGGPPMPPGPPPGVDEPPTKKQKTEESLIPEDQFLARNKGPVTFKVMVPPMPDKPEWKCNGQALQMTLPLTDTISVVKAKIFEETSMPAGKQKLQFEGLFVKDSNSLAFYNFSNGCTLQLGLKERGGRKR